MYTLYPFRTEYPFRTDRLFLRFGLLVVGLLLAFGCQNRTEPPPPIDPDTQRIVLQAE